MRKVLVTGAAGFIGYHLAKQALARGDEVVGIDNLNPYYDVSLKEARLRELKVEPAFRFEKLDLVNRAGILKLFSTERPAIVLHMAAQAGVRYSLEAPHVYVDSNLTGFVNLLEACRVNPVKHFIFASSSSVYGANTHIPFSVHDNVDHPLSLYAATKKANELIAHCYSHLFRISATGLRFFTVYGPWGRPDMAYFLFTKAILENRPIQIFNHGKMKRDFTYIDDVVEGVLRLVDHVPQGDKGWRGESPDPGSSFAPYRLYNIGNNQPVKLLEFVETLERCLGKKAEKRFLPLQPGDVPATCADIEDLEAAVGFRPGTPLAEGLRRFVDWYGSYYKV